MSFYEGVRNCGVTLISDDAYRSTLEQLIDRAQRRCLCSVFIVDTAPRRDAKLLVNSVLMVLRGALWRGVDVRLLIGGSRTNLDIAGLAAAARRWANENGLPCRWLTAGPVRGSHRKIVVADNWVLTGSHNWSPGAFGGQTQDSILLASAGLAERAQHLFMQQWHREVPA
jgi:phosphatidylserine/phosphatidylglycerophosphate/cardiolipin synthase-like enzyme